MAPAGLLHRCTGHWGGTDPVLPDSGQADGGFTEKFCTYIEENNWDAAKQLADTTRGEIAKLATIVMERHGNYEFLENFISYRAERALDKFEQNLPYLNIIVTLAPVLGLLGTVTGMMGAFNHITQRMENPMGVTAKPGRSFDHHRIRTVHFHCGRMLPWIL